jgi:sterol 3beta-glucosyltransferase
MQISILAFGSQGDVQPYIALGVGLLRADESVQIVTHENYETSVRAHGLEFHGVQGNVQEVIWQPPAALDAFLESGPAPVYIGFGSMGSRDPEQTAKLVLEAVKKTGQRAILQSGWGGLKADQLPNDVHLIGQTPHHWLFPKMAAVVHHGGAGTTAAGLRAGVPTTLIPFFGDQPFWGERVARLGVGTKPIPRKQLTSDNLAQAIQTSTQNSSIRQAATRIGEKIRAEDGIAKFVQALEQIKKTL